MKGKDELIYHNEKGTEDHLVVILATLVMECLTNFHLPFYARLGQIKAELKEE